MNILSSLSRLYGGIRFMSIVGSFYEGIEVGENKRENKENKEDT